MYFVNIADLVAQATYMTAKGQVPKYRQTLECEDDDVIVICYVHKECAGE